MPAFVKSEKHWNKAKDIAKKKGLKGESYWKYTTEIYKKMRPGDFAKAASYTISIIKHITKRID